MIIRFKEAKIDGIEVPDFELKEGELISLLVESSEFGFLLKDYLLGKKNNTGIIIFTPLTFVEHITFEVPFLDKLFNKNLLKHLIKREFRNITYQESEILEKAQIGPHWKVKGLGFNPTKTLATLLAIRKSNYIIYTTSGMDWTGAERLHQIVKEEIKISNGAAIEINVPALNGNRVIPEADKIIEIKIPSCNKVYKPLGEYSEFKLGGRL